MCRLGILSLLLVAFTNSFNSQCPPCMKLQNRILNGDFESGNVGFSSSLDYVTFFPFICTLCPENSYAIGNNAALFHSGFTGNDHTNPPTGDFFIANAPGSAASVVWCQTLSVFPQTEYTLTFWARDVADNPNPHPLAILIPSFNGIESSDTLVAEGGWSSLTTTWNSGNNTFLELCIINIQTETGGNDFGLDDLSLTACEPITLSQPAFAGIDASLCSNTPLQIGITPIEGYTYNWNAPDGLSADDISNPEVLIENNGDSIYHVSYIVERDSANVGCLASDTIHLSILPIHEVFIGNDTAICASDELALTIPSLWDQVLWSNGSTDQSTAFGIGTHNVIVTEGQCTKSDEIVISALAIEPTGIPDSIAHCATSPLLLEAPMEGTWNWNGNSSSNPIEVETSDTYFFDYISNSCAITDTVTVALFDLQYALLSPDTLLCEGSTLVLQSAAPGTWSTGTYGATLYTNLPGTYSISIVNGPCLTSDTITVSLINLPVVSLGNDTTFCEDDPVLLDASAPQHISYLWSTGDTTAAITSAGSGVYSVAASNACGTATDEIVIDNFPCSWQIYVPSCFTPNEDTFNEAWFATGYNINSMQVWIYNRFGDAIFYSPDGTESWKPGTAIGDDTYNYRIRAVTFQGEEVVKTGVIYLVR